MKEMLRLLQHKL